MKQNFTIEEEILWDNIASDMKTALTEKVLTEEYLHNYI